MTSVQQAPDVAPVAKKGRGRLPAVRRHTAAVPKAWTPASVAPSRSKPLSRFRPGRPRGLRSAACRGSMQLAAGCWPAAEQQTPAGKGESFTHGKSRVVLHHTAGPDAQRPLECAACALPRLATSEIGCKVMSDLARAAGHHSNMQQPDVSTRGDCVQCCLVSAHMGATVKILLSLSARLSELRHGAAGLGSA